MYSLTYGAIIVHIHKPVLLGKQLHTNIYLCILHVPTCIYVFQHVFYIAHTYLRTYIRM